MELHLPNALLEKIKSLLVLRPMGLALDCEGSMLNTGLEPLGCLIGGSWWVMSNLQPPLLTITQRDVL